MPDDVRYHLFTLLSAASLTLCAATAAVWVWAVASPSAGRPAATVAGHHLFLDQDRLVAVGLVDVWTGTAGGPDATGRVRPPADADADALRRSFDERWAAQLVPKPDWSRLGFGWEIRRLPLPPITASVVASPPGGLVVRTVQVPFWPACAATGLLPAAWATAAARRRRRRRAGLCVACGYDLRGSPGGRCPECGAVAERAAAEGVAGGAAA